MSNFISILSGTLLDASFNGTDLSDYKFYCYDFVKGLLPPQKETKIDIPGINGYTQLKKKFTSRPIKIYGYLNCSSHTDLIEKMQNISAFLYSDNDQQLILSNETDRYYNAQYLDYYEVKRKKDYAMVMLLFTCNDPFAYAIEADDNDEIGITVDGYSWTETNNGQYYVFPIVTITFNQSQTHIYLSNTSVDGCRFDISKSFVNTDVLVINSKDMSIRLNDVNSPAGFGDGGDGKGAFILFKIGDNLMEIGTDDATLDVDVNINFRKIYL